MGPKLPTRDVGRRFFRQCQRCFLAFVGAVDGAVVGVVVGAVVGVVVGIRVVVVVVVLLQCHDSQ